MGLRRLAISNPSANTDTTLVTADNQYLLSVIATNKSTTTPADIRVWVEPVGSSTAAEYAYIVYDLSVDQSNSYETFRFAVNQNDVVKIRSTTADLSFQAYGLIQYDVNLGVGISSYQDTAPTNVVNGLIWVDSDATIPGTSAKPIFIYDSVSESWVSTAASGIDVTANYTWTGTNEFTGTVVIPGYEKEIPLQSTAPISPSSSDLWIDSSGAAPLLKVYNGSSWTVVKQQEDRYTFTATGGETSVSGTDDNGNTLAYQAGYEKVFLNGILLLRTDDYTATNGTSITGLESLSAGYVLEVFSI